MNANQKMHRVVLGLSSVIDYWDALSGYNNTKEANT